MSKRLLLWEDFFKSFEVLCFKAPFRSFASNRGILLVVEAVARSLFRSSLALFGMMVYILVVCRSSKCGSFWRELCSEKYYTGCN